MFGQKNSELHTWVEERLSDFIDNQLAPAEHARVGNHLADCAQCRASLESMRWTIALVKHAPAPATRRSFTLPVPTRRASPSYAFGFARLATALATLLLFAVIGFDLISQFGSASAPVAMRESSATQSVAFAPTKAPEPTSAPKPVGAMSSAAPLPPAPAAGPPAMPTPSAVFRSSEVSPTQSVADILQKSQSATQPAQQPSVRGAAPITATVTATAPATATITSTQTATPVPPTVTATPLPTLTPTPAPTPKPIASAAPGISTLRVAEIGLLFLAIFFGTLMILLWRRV